MSGAGIAELAEPKQLHRAADLLPHIYQELRRLAAGKMARQGASHTLQATELVHEAWLRFSKCESEQFAGRTHFFATAAEAMRQLLIDRARCKRAARNGGGMMGLDIQECDIATQAPDDELLAVHEVLDQLAAEDPAKAELVKLRYFAGMNFEEAAAAMGVSIATAKRHWNYARAWLYHEIQANKIM